VPSHDDAAAEAFLLMVRPAMESASA
jgi:hypothetical protein